MNGYTHRVVRAPDFGVREMASCLKVPCVETSLQPFMGLICGREQRTVRGQREAFLQEDTWKCRSWVNIECDAVIGDGKTHSYCDVCH